MAKRRQQRELLTPFVSGEFDLTDKGALRYRKQILPLATINYEGRKLKFDRNLHAKVIAAFQDRAYDQVPFVLADGDNKHNEFAENFRGVVRDVSVERPGETPGLYAEIEFPNKKLAKAVLDNSELGVSCRLREFVEKSDGRKYDVALRHLCGTLDPRVTGMEPWKTVELSDSSSCTIVDLTSATYQEEDMAAKGKKKGTTKERGVDLAQLVADIEGMSTEDLTEFVQQNLDLSDSDDDSDEDELPEGGANTAHTGRRPDDSEDVIEDDEDEDDEEDDEDEDGGDPDLSDQARYEIDLAHSRAEEAQANASRALQMLADQRWDSERKELLGRGIPARLVDLCEPFLHVTEASTIDLTEGKRLNATSRIRKVLDEVAGYLDLSGPKGHNFDPQESNGQTAKDKAVLDNWSKTYGE